MPKLLDPEQVVAFHRDGFVAPLRVLSLGETAAYRVRTVHASGPNRADDRRIGIALRYIAPHVRQLNGERDSAMLVRGADRFGNFVHEKPPQRDMDASALDEHARVMKLRQEILYQDVEGKPAHIES